MSSNSSHWASNLDLISIPSTCSFVSRSPKYLQSQVKVPFISFTVPLYCCKRNRIWVSSNYVLLSTEQIPRAFYWISLPGTRQIPRGIKITAKSKRSKSFTIYSWPRSSRQPGRLPRLPFLKERWLESASQVPAAWAKSGRLAGRWLQHALEWEGSHTGLLSRWQKVREEEDTKKGVKRESLSDQCTEKSPFCYRKQHKGIYKYFITEVLSAARVNSDNSP